MKDKSEALSGLELRSTLKGSGALEVSLITVAVPVPKADEVVVRIEAAPINPSDLGLLLGPADMATARASGPPDRPVITAEVPSSSMPGMAARLDQSLPVGNEGAGTVVQAGGSAAAQALLGKSVAVVGGAMYAQYRTLKIDACFVLPDGATAADGASSFVNPLTALGMVWTMQAEGHRALVHTAAASNLGQMLSKVCQKDGVALVNIVRSADHVDLLRGLGATYVCNSSSSGFMEDLVAALEATGATIAFDAIGGGPLAGQILSAMERAANTRADSYSRYGSAIHKQVYIYGGLDTRPTEITRRFGMAWSVGGWLLTYFLQKAGAETVAALRQRVASELKTTFSSRYTRTISLTEALSLDMMMAYNRRATGEKYLIDPSLDRA